MERKIIDGKERTNSKKKGRVGKFKSEGFQ